MGRYRYWYASVEDGSLVAPVGRRYVGDVSGLIPLLEVTVRYMDFSDDDLRGLPLRWVYIDDDPFPVLERLSECE